MPDRRIALLLIAPGVILILLGVIAALGGLSWFGHLPGDIRIVGERTRFYFPITSMLVISIVLTIVINLLRRLL